MKFTDRTRRVLAYRRHAREMARAGWEYVGEGGGHLWQLVRGSRRGQRIVAATPALDGLGVWVLIMPATDSLGATSQ